jgi:hypothetical protein
MKIEIPKAGIELIRAILEREVKKAISEGDIPTAMPLQDLSTRLELATEIKITQ